MTNIVYELVPLHSSSIFTMYNQWTVTTVIHKASTDILHGYKVQKPENFFDVLDFWTRNLSHIAIHLVVLVFVPFLLGSCCSKKPKAPWFQIRSGWNQVRLFFDWWSRISDMMAATAGGGQTLLAACRVSCPSLAAVSVVYKVITSACSSWSIHIHNCYFCLLCNKYLSAWVTLLSFNIFTLDVVYTLTSQNNAEWINTQLWSE